MSPLQHDRGLPQWDCMDREEEALRAWVIHYDKSGNTRQADMIARDIERMWEMRGRRGWTSRLRPGVPRYGSVEDFSNPVQREHWTNEPELD